MHIFRKSSVFLKGLFCRFPPKINGLRLYIWHCCHWLIDCQLYSITNDYLTAFVNVGYTYLFACFSERVVCTIVFCHSLLLCGSLYKSLPILGKCALGFWPPDLSSCFLAMLVWNANVITNSVN